MSLCLGPPTTTAGTATGSCDRSPPPFPLPCRQSAGGEILLRRRALGQLLFSGEDSGRPFAAVEAAVGLHAGLTPEDAPRARRRCRGTRGGGQRGGAVANSKLRGFPLAEPPTWTPGGGVGWFTVPPMRGAAPDYAGPLGSGPQLDTPEIEIPCACLRWVCYAPRGASSACVFARGGVWLGPAPGRGGPVRGAGVCGGGGGPRPGGGARPPHGQAVARRLPLRTHTNPFTAYSPNKTLQAPFLDFRMSGLTVPLAAGGGGLLSTSADPASKPLFL